MMFAGHLPIMNFEHADWLSIKVWPTGSGDMPENGFYRSTMRGKPVVFYTNYENKEHFTVRPVVRVPMGRAVV